MMTKNSIYRGIYTRKEHRINKGYNYADKILKNSMSNQMFNVNETFSTFLKYINDIVFNLIEPVKQIKVFANPALDKYETNIN